MTTEVVDYQERDPGEVLRPFVRSLWSYGRPAADEQVQPIPGDGCCELIVHLGTPHEEVDAQGHGSLQPPVMFVGQLTRPLHVRAPGPTRVLAVRFRPDGAGVWFRRSLTLATDRRLDVALTHPSFAEGLVDHLERSADPLKALAERVTETLRPDLVIDAEVRPIVEAAERGDAVRLDRRLQRRFLKQVGVSARTLRAILRFRAVFDRIGEGGDPSWLTTALSAGYFDQPQMTRDFRRFLGRTPSDWTRQKLGLAQSLVSESYKTPPLPAA